MNGIPRDTHPDLSIEGPASRYAADLVLAEMASIRRLAEAHGLTFDPRAIEAEARDRVALALVPRKPINSP